MAIDLFKKEIWIAFGAALLLLTPIANARARNTVFACINLSFILMLVGIKMFPVAAVLLFLCWLALSTAGKQRGRHPVPLVAACAMFVLWLFYKTPLAGHAFDHHHKFTNVLGALGFSYVLLRFLDAIRSIADGRHTAPNLVRTVNYLVPFHMLAAGPIQAFDEYMEDSGAPEPLSFEGAVRGAERIASGLFKKFVIAQIISRVFLTSFKAHMPYAIIEAQFYYLWLYLDFSAYSDIAVGIGSLIGVATPENFNNPLVARNIIDYWQRWHITLSQFIRRNIFIPVQVSLVRRSDGKNELVIACVAFFVSFLLCGLWHNVNFRWLLWGAIQAAGLSVCYVFRHYLVKKHGRKWLNARQANATLKVISIAITFEFSVFALAATMYDWG